MSRCIGRSCTQYAGIFLVLPILHGIFITYTKIKVAPQNIFVGMMTFIYDIIDAFVPFKSYKVF